MSSPIVGCTGRSQAAVCTWQGKIYVVGGCDAWHCTNTMVVYDPQTEEQSCKTYMYTVYII